LFSTQECISTSCNTLSHAFISELFDTKCRSDFITLCFFRPSIPSTRYSRAASNKQPSKTLSTTTTNPLEEICFRFRASVYPRSVSGLFYKYLPCCMSLSVSFHLHLDASSSCRVCIHRDRSSQYISSTISSASTCCSDFPNNRYANAL
jgi:hypothetical protein